MNGSFEYITSKKQKKHLFQDAFKQTKIIKKLLLSF